MKDTKRRLEPVSMYDHTGIEKRLKRMAEKGWMLEKIGRGIWKFKSIEPSSLHFAVTYFPKASEYDPEPSEEQVLFYEMYDYNQKTFNAWYLFCDGISRCNSRFNGCFCR